MNKVFICYSHKDKKYLDLLLKHLDNDLDVWSDKRIEGAEHWEEEIQKALDSCNCGVLLLSGNFFNSRFIKDIELKQLLQNQHEKNTFLLPVLAEYCNIDNYTWIKKKEVLPKGFKALENIKKRNHNKEAVKIGQRVETLLQRQPEQIKKEEKDSNSVVSINYPDGIGINNFPESNDGFFGREKYLDILDKSWNDEQVNILSFIAFGGIGKTSLIDNWLKIMKEDHYRGAKNIFMWSFYSQGSEEDRQVTAAEFLLEACKFFKIKKIPKTAYEQGRELADIVSKQRALLVLDGLEPLQSSLENIGKIKDNGLQVLLKRLSRQSKGLVIITSRIKLASIDNQYEELEKLEDSEGAKLLNSFKLNGSIKELEQISKDFDGHALALKLLGSYTKVVLDGDITRIDEIDSLRDDKSKSSKHATRMLNSYKKYLQREGKVELDILKLLGFFDRAISFEVINVLKNKPLIKNINDSLVEISEINWKYALDNLKKLHLISSSEKVLDTHPLVREYFSECIQEEFEDSYITGHYRLCKYYEKLPEKEYPDTVEEMEPLFQSIYHGCHSFNYNEAMQLFIDRIDRTVDNKNYLTITLGRFDLYFKLMINFFEKYYNKVTDKLDLIHHHGIISNTAYFFSTTGNYNKALDIYLCLLKNSEKLKNTTSMIYLLSNILDIYLFTGQFKELEKIYKTYSKYCNFNNKNIVMIDSTYAYYKFLSGDFAKSKELFEQCNQIMKNEISIELHGYSGDMYRNFLYYFNETNKIKNNIKQAMKISIDLGYPLDNGINYISLGRLKLLDNVNQKNVFNLYNKAIEYLRKSNEIKFICEGLIYRANAYRHYKKINEANDDLQESYDLIIRSEAKLLLADWYIVAIKLAFDEKNHIKANTNFIEAKELSTELSDYFIFKEELKKLESIFAQEDKR